MIDNTEQIRRFVRELDISAPDSSMPEAYRSPMLATAPTGQRGAAVNCGSLVSFVEGLDAQYKADVQNSTLLAQLAANKKFDRMEDVINWFDFYITILQTVGWNIPSLKNQEYTPSSKTFTLASVTLEIMQGVATQKERDLVEATMNALQATGDDSNQMEIWSANSFKGSFGSFQIFPVIQTSEGDVAMVLGAVQFKADFEDNRFLWRSSTSQQMSITRSAGRYLLNKDTYKEVRDDVVSKLGASATKFIADLDL